MLHVLLAQQPAIKEVRVPDSLYWYMGIGVALCIIVFLLFPLIVSRTKSRPIPRQDDPDADHD